MSAKSRLVFFIVSVVVVFTTTSCNDSVDPVAPFEENYVFYCIINADSTFQTANVFRSYSAQDLDPYNNKIDPVMNNALVSATYKGVEYKFRDSVTNRVDTRYSGPFHYYYNDRLKIIGGTQYETPDSLKFKVVLPNQVLQTTILTIPSANLYLEKSPKLFGGFKPSDYKIEWNFFNRVNKVDNYYYKPALDVYYFIKNGASTIWKKTSIPLSRKDGLSTGDPIYTKIMKTNYIYLDPDEVVKAFKEISAGDYDKSRYVITKVELKLTILDKNVTAYYEAENVFENDFSIRIDKPDFSNINGGLGICGIYVTRKFFIILNGIDLYEQFGYLYEPKQ